MEAHDKAAMHNHVDSLIGELVIDATASHLAKYTDPVVLLRHIAGEAYNYTPDHGEIHQVITERALGLYRSGQVVDDGQSYDRAAAT